MPIESTPQTEPQVFCSQCGKPYSPAEVVTVGGATVCAACKPGFLRRMQEGGLPPARRYKGFWIRALELLVDGLVLSAVYMPLMIYFMLPVFRAAVTGVNPALFIPSFTSTIMALDLLIVCLAIAYNTLMLGRFGATLGDMVIGAKVVTPEGQPISYARALGRSLMKEVSGLILWIGFLIAAFDEQKRTLHDRVAGTVVIAK